MTAPSGQFLVFVLTGACVFNAVPVRWRESVWLVLNLAFVLSLSWAVGPLLPLAAFLALGFFGAALARRGVGPMMIVLVLAVFVWLKRYSFIPNALLLPDGAMLVGLSYIFFRVMHLVIDAGQGAEPIGAVRYLNFVLNFPAFLSGPIQRREDYEANNALALTLADIGLATWRMVLGAFKVLIVSAVVSGWHRDAIAALMPDQQFGHRVITGTLVVVLYPLFLYANFSGYTDFVIGAARLFRLRLPENFDHPFTSVNFMEFWSRWHITLSQWLRSYVFNTLLVGWMRRVRSARGKNYPAIVAFFVTFFLVGAWHGQTAAFLFFGVLQGGGVAGNRLYQVEMNRWMTPVRYRQLATDPIYRAFARGLTFTWFAFTLLWFWANWAQIGGLAATLGFGGSIAVAVAAVCGASVVLSVPFTGVILQSRYVRTALAAAMLLAISAAALVLNLSSPEIVYQQF